MGGVQSSLPEPTPTEPFFAIVFHRPDRIKIVLADRQTIEVIRRACHECWSRGFQLDERQEDGSYHLKFSGYLFSPDTLIMLTVEDTSESKQLATRLLIDLREIGWQFCLSSDLTRYSELTTWFFQRSRPRPQQLFKKQLGFCLSLNWTDTLQIVGADLEIHELIKNAVITTYRPGLQEENRCGDSCYELKLLGTPWHTRHADLGIWARKLLLEIIRRLHVKKWRLYATGNLKGTVDSLFFINNNQEPDQTEEFTSPDDQFCVVSLNANDRLRLIDCPDSVIDTTRSVIQNSWPRGLQKEIRLDAEHAGAHEFQLYGTPWWANGGDTVASRAFLNDLFDTLLSRGWCLASTLDISRRDNDKSFFILRSCQPGALPHFCLSLNETDKIRVIGAPIEIIQMVDKVVSANWPVSQKNDDYHGWYEMKLQGKPWAPFSSNESMLCRVLMCRLLAEFYAKGWTVISSADVSSKYYKQGQHGPTYPEDVHSWFLAYVGIGAASARTVGAVDGAMPIFGEMMVVPSSPPPTYDEAMTMNK